MSGISKLREKLLGLACENGKVIPPAWLELLKQIQDPETREMPYLDLGFVENLDHNIRRENTSQQSEQNSLYEDDEEVTASAGSGISSETRSASDMDIVGTNSGSGAGPVATVEDRSCIELILRFFHAIGMILWFEHTTELSQFIFHNPEYLANLMKAIFTERLETESLQYSSFKSKFSCRKFEQAKENLLQRGIMSRELLECLWRHKALDEEVLTAMIDLFMHMDLCYALHKDGDGRVSSLRFPWFLAEKAPEDPELHQILFGTPALNCHRIVLEYEFFRICPPPMYEKFAVRMHRRIYDKESRRDWRDGFQANIKGSRFVVQKFHRDLETVIRFTVEGEDVMKLWKVLTELRKEMHDVMEEWPGVKRGSHYSTFVLCPHCVRQCVKRPHLFPGQNALAEQEFPEDELWMTCKRDRATKVPACLVLNVKDLPKEHKDALQQFMDEMSKDIRGGVRLVGYVKETYSVLGVEFLEKLLKYSKSVGIIMSRHSDGRQSSTGTVFRVGSRFVMTNQHVVESIAASVGGEAYLGDPRSVFVSFNYGRPSQAGERSELHLDFQNPVVWRNRELDAAVLQLDTQSQTPPPLGPLWGNASRSASLYLIGHDNRAGNKLVLDLQCPVRRFADLAREFVERCPDPGMNDPRRTLLTSSLSHGSSGSPGFDEFGSLVVMYATGYPQENVRSGMPTDVEQAVNIAAIREQLRSDNPQLANELFPIHPAVPAGESMELD